MSPAPPPGFVDRFFWRRKLSTHYYRHQLARGYPHYHNSDDFEDDWVTHDTQTRKVSGL